MSVSENPYAPPTSTTSARGIEWMKTDTAALSKTALGLSLVYYGIVLFLLSIILMFAAAFFAPVLIISIGGIIIGSVLMFVGPLLCLSVPAETNAKGLIIGTVVLQVINLGFPILPTLGVELSGFQSFAQIFGVLSAICFVLFMRRLAQFIGREDLASRARNVLVLGIVVFLTAIGGFVAIFALMDRAELSFFGIMLVVMLLGLVLFVMYANLVNALSKALKSNESTTSSVATAE